jgi:hypothetical protein
MQLSDHSYRLFQQARLTMDAEAFAAASPPKQEQRLSAEFLRFMH